MNKRNSTGLISGLFTGCLMAALTLILAGTPAQAMQDELTLPLAQIGSAKILISIPDSEIASSHTLPVIFVVSGFQTAKQLTPIMGKAAGDNIVVVFEYPLDDKSNFTSWSNPDDVKQLNNIATIPLQIVGVLNWIRSPAFMVAYGVSADVSRINAVAISLGVLFLPSALRLDQMAGHSENSIAFAYAGAKLNLVAQQQMSNNGGASIAQVAGQVIQVLATPFEPLNYVGQLRASHFLLLNADEDQVFPRESQQALLDATPQPRDEITVPGLHIGMNQPERVESSISSLKNWMVQNGAANP